MRSKELARLVRRAKEERAGLRGIWEQGNVLRGREQVWLARDLAAIKPVMIVDAGGNRRRCESRFSLKRGDRRRIAHAMLADGETDSAVRRWTDLSQDTVRRLRREIGGAGTPEMGSVDRLVKRSKAAKNSNPTQSLVSTRKAPKGVPPQTAYLDATSGANAEAELTFVELVDSPMIERYSSAAAFDNSCPQWHIRVYGGVKRRHYRKMPP